ncbi:peptide chain release factor mitochondrial isoform X3 [Biomphalaria glabrata]|nr:putative peptide chain release factor C12orf65; mitochondrial isoform X3 [Biomphalaria glabrata]
MCHLIDKLAFFSSIRCERILHGASYNRTADIGTAMNLFNYHRLFNLNKIPNNRCLRTQLTFSIQLRNYSIRRKDFTFPELKEEDLEETFVRGSGPGGQAVNQTANCVVLKHKPTGIVIKCHESRSLEENRKIAKLRLEDKLDLHLHGEESYLGQIEKEERISRKEKKNRAQKKLALKKAFKERENLD